jgi:hypothetical protein
VLDQIEAEQRQQVSELIPDNISLTELAEQVVRGKVKLSREQMRMLIELCRSTCPSSKLLELAT